MARRVKSADLETREARRKLKPRGQPYYQTVGLGLHVGYRRNRRERSNVWLARRYSDGAYTYTPIGLADDTEDADGVHVLNFFQAVDVARQLRTPRTGAYTVRSAAADYLIHLAGRTSHKSVKSAFNSDLQQIAETPVHELTADVLVRWHRDIASRPARVRSRPGEVVYKETTDHDTRRKREATANLALKYLKSALNLALANDKVSCAPVWSKVRLFRGASVPRSRYLTLDECRRLIEACDGDFKALVQSALQTGCRYQELARLRVSDLDARAGTLHIRSSKSGHDRHVVLTEEGCKFFSRLAVNKKPSDLLLGRHWGPSCQGRPMREACARAGIENANFHALRHTWASLSVMAGMPLMVVARNLGHVDTQMVERHYGHLAQSYISDEVRKHAPRFGKTPSNASAL